MCNVIDILVSLAHIETFYGRVIKQRDTKVAVSCWRETDEILAISPQASISQPLAIILSN